jgi:predicted amidohydrolase
MNASIRVAALQLQAHNRNDFRGATERIVAAVRSAAENADLIVLPEATFPAYVLGHAPLDKDAVDAALGHLREIAVETQSVIVAGAAASTDAGIYNAAFVVDADGSVAGRADKLFLWHFDRRWFTPGERIAPIPTAIGRLGVLICADGRIPTIARALVDAGATVLVMPTAWVTSGRDPHALENVQADLLARVRAYENRVPFIAANKCGSELGMVAYCGKSQIVDSSGELVAIAGEREPETLQARVTLSSERPRRATAARELATAARAGRGMRIAISFDPLPFDVDERLEILDDAYAVSPYDDARATALDLALPTASVGDDIVVDPGGLIAYRRAGYSLIRWSTDLGAPWSERIARARALELRMYFVVFDRALRRAFAVDPEGTVVAGTFDGFHLASFTFDPRKAAETVVAPGSDVFEGIERIARIVDAAPR